MHQEGVTKNWFMGIALKFGGGPGGSWEKRKGGDLQKKIGRGRYQFFVVEGFDLRKILWVNSRGGTKGKD